MKAINLTAGLAMMAMSAGGLAITQPTYAQNAVAQTASAVPEMRTRLLTSLTGYEIEEYLKRNDVIYVPVGPTEINGGNPVDVEYVVPLAYATRLAEKSDGLVFPYLAYFYPGGTTTSRGTVMVTPTEGIAYLKVLTHSLIRQGFRRIVYLTSHGPSGATLQPVIREIYDETHVPVVWMQASNVRPPESEQSETSMASMMETRQRMIYGAYAIVGRLDDMPVGLAEPERELPNDRSWANLNAAVGSEHAVSGNFYGDPSEHGGLVSPVTAEERERLGREGQAYIESQVAGFDTAALLDAIRQQEEHTKRVEARFGDLLPGSSVD